MIIVEAELPKNLPSIPAGSVDAALDAVGAMARDRIGQYAAKKLKSTYVQYLYGLQQPRSFERMPGQVTIRLLGSLPQLLEHGAPLFDMKPGLLGGSRVKRSKDGVPYTDVPFRHGMPGSKRFQPMPKSVAANMADAVRSAKLQGKSTARIQLKDRTKGTKGRVAGLWDQMTRVEKNYAAAKQATYRTFRRVSRNSAKDAWVHPGFPGIRSFETVAKEMDEIFPRVLLEYVKNGIGGRP